MTGAITTALAATAGFFPLDDQLALWDGHWSEGLARDAVWLGGMAPSYGAAEAIWQRIGRTNISATSIWRRVQVWGAQFQALADDARATATATPEVWTPPSRAEVSDQRMGVAMDGTTMYILQEGWKEVKVGTVFEIAVGPTPDERTGEVVDLAHAVHNSYVAHLGGPEVLGELVWTEARRRGWEQAQDTEVLGDGAPWIWNQAALHFPASHQLVDWYHGKQHLIAAGQALKEPASLAYQRWLTSRETLLYQGQAARIAGELAQAAGPPATAPAEVTPVTTPAANQEASAAAQPPVPATVTPAQAASATPPAPTPATVTPAATPAPTQKPPAAAQPPTPATVTRTATPALSRPDVLRREAGYFEHNQHRMNYLEMREEEWPIGSGMVESAAKQYKARFCGPGMRWSRAGAEKLLPVRSAILSHRFDDVWTQVYNAPQN